MNIKEFEVVKKKPYDLTLVFELFEGSNLDKRAQKVIEQNDDLFAESKMDNEVFRYNISNKMSLRKYLTLGMDKETMVYIVRRILEVERFFNANGLNKDYLLYDSDLILVDKDSEVLTFVPMPASDHGLTVKPLRAFVKEVVANAIYDEEENLDYVGRLLTYVNSHKEIFPNDLEAVLGGIEAAASAPSVKRESGPMIPVVEEPAAVDDMTRIYKSEDVKEENISAGMAAASAGIGAATASKEMFAEPEKVPVPEPVMPQIILDEPQVSEPVKNEPASFEIPEIIIPDQNQRTSEPIIMPEAPNMYGEAGAPEMPKMSEPVIVPEVPDMYGQVREPEMPKMAEPVIMPETPNMYAEVRRPETPNMYEEVQRAEAPNMYQETRMPEMPKASEMQKEDNIKLSVEPQPQPGMVRETPESHVKSDNQQGIPVKKYPYLVRTKTQEIITIDKDEFKIGKIPGMADYLLSDNPAVSRMHAIIHNVDGAYYICDNYSTNGTFLNGDRLEPGKNYLLLNSVKISIANDEFTYLLNQK
ncbi:MAG: FHA domain-containing protein [Clostridiales bacterium]|nr:FHA domain-containing protein [Clostridiales bacterium]MDY3745535.1 FHA domain-containing protein [Lachnospiraceae bacterium]